MEEGVLGLVVCGLDGFSEFYGVDDGRCGGDVYDFHDGVVDGEEFCKEVEVACDEYE